MTLISMISGIGLRNTNEGGKIQKKSSVMRGKLSEQRNITMVGQLAMKTEAEMLRRPGSMFPRLSQRLNWTLRS